MFGALDLSTSALVANRIRLDVISANIANVDVPIDPRANGPAFSERIALLASGDPESGSPLGVHVAAIESRNAFHSVYDRSHPMAGPDGYVRYPTIDPVVQQANAMLAARAYDANLAAIEATKSMIDASLRIIA